MDVFELREKLARDYAAYTTSFVQISLVKAAQGLRFLVLDELHTYRGRQGLCRQAPSAAALSPIMQQ